MIAHGSGCVITAARAAHALFASGVSAGDGLTATRIRSRVAEMLALSSDRDLEERVDAALLADREGAERHLAWCRVEVARAFGGAR